MRQKENKLTWENITLKQFLELQAIEENAYTGEELVTKRISVIFDVDAESLTIPDYMEKAKQCEFLANPIPTGKAKSKYTINGNTYIPMLNPFQMIMGQYIDFKHILENKPKYEDMLSIILIPENHTYNDGGYNLQEAKQDFLNLPITDVVSLGNFFFRLMKKYQIIFQLCLKRLLKKTKKNKEIQSIIRQITEQIKQITDTV
jgi:hypothetical protein